MRYFKLQAYLLWKRLFEKKHIEEHYHEKIEQNPSIGMDRITPKSFNENLNDNISIIQRKVNNNTYHFTNYRQLLFSKGKGKEPRCICVSTLRDKLTLSILNEIIIGIYGKLAQTQMPQVIINDIVNELNAYDCFIKLDIKTFYSTLDHEILLQELKKKIRKKEVLNLINSAIKTEAVSIPIKSKKEITKRVSGVPEGLSISNALANIFMLPIDEKYSKIINICYWRYVDDILILFNKDEAKDVEENIIKEIEKRKLKINEKKDQGYIIDGFEYLGYRISNTGISVRKSSVYKIENSLEELIRDFRKKNSSNIKYLEWKMNLKITGFILDGKKYGWMFFYSQINELFDIYKLDCTVKKMLDRYGINGEIHIKRFVRTYHEITKALHVTTYIPNIDQISNSDKKEILSDIYMIDLSDLNDEKIEIKFRKIMMREIIDIQKDVQSIS